MAKDSQGRKFNRIKPYSRVVNGVRQRVPEHIRSNKAKSKCC